MPTVAQRVREHIAANPTLSAAMRSGVANTSAVARLVAKDLGIPRTQAVLAACRRYPKDPGGSRQDRALARIMRRCRILTRGRVATVTVSAGIEELRILADVVAGLLRDDQMVRLVQGSRTVVVVVDEDDVERLTSKLTPAQVIGVKRDLSEVTVKGPVELERTPGVMALLTNALSAQGVNILQGMLFPVDMIFLVSNSDMPRSVNAFARLLGQTTS
jgi:aspartokinase